MPPTVITRWRKRPPEVDVLLISEATIELAISWLRRHGRDAYRAGSNLHVTAGPVGAGFEVGPGELLVHDLVTLRWAPVSADQLAREYAPLDRDPRPRPPLPARPPGVVGVRGSLGQPGGGL